MNNFSGLSLVSFPRSEVLFAQVYAFVILISHIIFFRLAILLNPSLPHILLSLCRTPWLLYAIFILLSFWRAAPRQLFPCHPYPFHLLPNTTLFTPILFLPSLYRSRGGAAGLVEAAAPSGHPAGGLQQGGAATHPRCGQRVAVLHQGSGDGERSEEEWQKGVIRRKGLEWGKDWGERAW